MVAERQGAERENQKRRTRRDLLNAAVQLMHAGQTPSVADVADQAGVSRRTAYRYFATVEQLLTEAALEATRPMIEDVLTGAGDGIGDVGERVERLARALLDGFYANEHLLRTMIRLTIDHPPGEGGLARRGYRRLEWIDLAIAPLHGHLTATGYQRLRASLAVCLGTEAFIVLRDICGLHDAELERTVITTVHALVTQATSPGDERRPAADERLRRGEAGRAGRARTHDRRIMSPGGQQVPLCQLTWANVGGCAAAQADFPIVAG